MLGIKWYLFLKTNTSNDLMAEWESSNSKSGGTQILMSLGVEAKNDVVVKCA